MGGSVMKVKELKALLDKAGDEDLVVLTFREDENDETRGFDVKLAGHDLGWDGVFEILAGEMVTG